MTCCHEVISARHMDHIFLQFNAEMNQIVYSGRYRVTGARLLRVRSRARVATGPKSIALLPLWFLKLSRTPKPLHFLLHVFISLSIRPSYGARGEEILDGGGSALSLFRFHLSPFPPETPDTQAMFLFFHCCH